MIPFEAVHPHRHHRRAGAGRSGGRMRERRGGGLPVPRGAARYLARALQPSDVVWRYAGASAARRRLARPSAVTRDCTRMRSAAARRCSRSSAARSPPIVASPSTSWTSCAPTFPSSRAPGPSAPRFRAATTSREDARRRSSAATALPVPVVEGAFSATAALAAEVLGDGITGEHYGAGLTGRAGAALLASASGPAAPTTCCGAGTKAGLHRDARQQARVAEAMGR